MGVVHSVLFWVFGGSCWTPWILTSVLASLKVKLYACCSHNSDCSIDLSLEKVYLSPYIFISQSYWDMFASSITNLRLCLSHLFYLLFMSILIYLLTAALPRPGAHSFSVASLYPTTKESSICLMSEKGHMDTLLNMPEENREEFHFTTERIFPFKGFSSLCPL